MNWDLILKELSEASIYAILMVLGFIMFLIMYKFGMQELKNMMNTSIQSIERAYKDSNDKLTEYIDKHSKQ